MDDAYTPRSTVDDTLSEHDLRQMQGGASDYLLALDGIEGESSPSFGRAGGGGAGKVSFQDIAFAPF